ncbi:MAG: kelch repeat-containing protein [Patescibacteria group bacterium]
MTRLIKTEKIATCSLLIAFCSLAVVLYVGAQSDSRFWSDPHPGQPTASPEEGAPLTTSAADQTKSGHLTVGEEVTGTGLISNDRVDIGPLLDCDQTTETCYGDINLGSGGSVDLAEDLEVDANQEKLLRVSGSGNKVGILTDPTTYELDVAGETYIKSPNNSDKNALKVNTGDGTGLSGEITFNSDSYFAVQGEGGDRNGGGIYAEGGSADSGSNTYAIKAEPGSGCAGNCWAAYFRGRLKIETGFREGDSDNYQRIYHTATKLNDGKVLFIGGLDGEDFVPNRGVYYYVRRITYFDPISQQFGDGPYLQVPRSHHTANLLGNDVLVAGGYKWENTEPSFANMESTDSVEMCNTGTCLQIDTLDQARANHTATTANNEVVIIGGDSKVGDQYLALNTIEHCNATTCISPGVNLITARTEHTATLLDNGLILIAGGKSSENNYLNSTELYDPLNHTIAQGPSFTDARADHTATKLDDGRVFIAGGYRETGNSIFGTHYNSSVIYSPGGGVGSFNDGPTMLLARSQHTATLLSGGQVMILGGENDAKASTKDTNEIFNPNDNTISEGPALLGYRMGHTATLLDSGEVLVGGGRSDFFDGSTVWQKTEYFSTLSDDFSLLSSETTTHSYAADQRATLLSDGTVLLTGGRRFPYRWIRDLPSNNEYTASVFDPPTDTFRNLDAADNDLDKLGYHTATAATFASKWWSSGEGYPARERLMVTNRDIEDLPPGYVATLALPRAEWDDKLLDDEYDDLRIVYYNQNDGFWLDLNRHVVATDDTLYVYFRLIDLIGIGDTMSDTRYFLYYGNAEADTAPANKSAVYDIWADFEEGIDPDDWATDIYSGPQGTLGIDSIDSDNSSLTLSHGDPAGVEDVDKKTHTTTITVKVVDQVDSPVGGAIVTITCSRGGSDCTDDVFLSGNSDDSNGSGNAEFTFTAPWADTDEISYGYTIVGDYSFTATATHPSYQGEPSIGPSTLITTNQPTIDNVNIQGPIFAADCVYPICELTDYVLESLIDIHSEGVPVRMAKVKNIIFKGKTCSQSLDLDANPDINEIVSDEDTIFIYPSEPALPACDNLYYPIKKLNYNDGENGPTGQDTTWIANMCPPECDWGGLDIKRPLAQADCSVSAEDQKPNSSFWDQFISSLFTIEEVVASELESAWPDDRKVAEGQVLGIVEGETPSIFEENGQVRIDGQRGSYAHIEIGTGRVTTPDTLVLEGKIKTVEDVDEAYQEDELAMGLALYWDQNNWAQIRQRTLGGNQWVITQMVDGTPTDTTNVAWGFNLNQYYCVNVNLDRADIVYSIAPTIGDSESCDQIEESWTELATIARPLAEFNPKPSKIIVGKGTGTADPNLDNVGTPTNEVNTYYADDILVRGTADPEAGVTMAGDLPDEAVLITGGHGGTYNGDEALSVEVSDKTFLYYPDFTGSGNDSLGERGTTLPGGPRTHHTATLLSDGTIYIAGGYYSLNTATDALQSTLIYNPDDDTFSNGPDLPTTGRANHTAVALSGNQVLIIGGNSKMEDDSLNSAVLIDFDAPVSVSEIGNIGGARSYHTATLLPDDSILIAGGINLDKNQVMGGNVLNSTVVYDSGDFNDGPDLSRPRFHHTATLTNDGSEVLLIGGETLRHYQIGEIDRYLVASNTVSDSHPALYRHRTHHQAVLADSIEGTEDQYNVYVFGGLYGWQGIQDETFLFQEAAMEVQSSEMVVNLNADLLDSYDSDDFVLISQVGEEYVVGQNPASWQPQSGSLRVDQLSQISYNSDDSLGGIEAVSSASTVPAVTVTHTGAGDASKALEVKAEPGGVGYTTYGIYAQAGSGVGDHFAAYFGGQVFLDSTGPLTIQSNTQVANLNVDKLDGFHIDDFILTKDLAQYAKFDQSGLEQTGNIHVSNIAKFTEDTISPTLNITNKPSAYSYASEGVETTGGLYALRAIGGTAAGTNYAGYFEGDVKVTEDLYVTGGKLIFEGSPAAGSSSIAAGNNCSDTISPEGFDAEAHVMITVTDFGTDSNNYNVRVNQLASDFEVCTFGDSGNPAVNFDYLIVKSL